MRSKRTQSCVSVNACVVYFADDNAVTSNTPTSQIHTHSTHLQSLLHTTHFHTLTSLIHISLDPPMYWRDYTYIATCIQLSLIIHIWLSPPLSLCLSLYLSLPLSLSPSLSLSLSRSTYIYIYIYTFMYTHLHICTNKTNIYMHLHIHIHISIYAYLRIHTGTCIYICEWMQSGGTGGRCVATDSRHSEVTYISRCTNTAGH